LKSKYKYTGSENKELEKSKNSRTKKYMNNKKKNGEKNNLCGMYIVRIVDENGSIYINTMININLDGYFSSMYL